MTDDAQRRDFLARAEELCDALYADVRGLRDTGALTPRERRALLDRAFRDAHTLKGVASALPQLAAAGRLAHELEHLLEALRAARSAPEEDAVDACEEAADLLARAVESAAHDAHPPDASEIIARLRRHAAAHTSVDAQRTNSDDAARTNDDAVRAGDEEERRMDDAAAAREDEPRLPHSASHPPHGESRAPHGATRAQFGAARSSPDLSRPAHADSRASLDPSRESSSEAEDEARAAVVPTPFPTEIGALLNAEERRRIEQVRAEGARLVLCEVVFDLSDFDERFRRLTDALAEFSEIVSTLPAAPGSTAVAQIGFRLLCAADEPRKLSPLAAQFGARLTELATRTENLGDDDNNFGDAVARAAKPHDAERSRLAKSSDDAGRARARLHDDAAGVASSEGDSSDVGSFDVGSFDGGSFDGDPSDGGSSDHSPSVDAASSSSPSFVRVQLSELDELIFAANELFDDAMRALDAARLPSDAAGAGARVVVADDAPLPVAPDETAARVRRDLVALVERVMALRMQPLGRTLERAARAARVAARRGGKRVEFEFAGGEARVDRAVAERLVAPLEHLLRNAVTHGIESPAERRRAGKDSRGRVRVEASAEGSRVRVNVADDGRGVDVSRVEGAARAQGLVAVGARLTQEQALRLIFRPGFSTAGEVSQSAGRGVGLDAVEHEIESAGGEVHVRTRQGRGTTFELRLPLALALVPAVLARAGAHAYAIDASRVVETLSRDERATEDDATRRTITWRGSRLPLLSLRELIGQGTATSGDSAATSSDGTTRRDDDAARRDNDAARLGDDYSTRVLVVRLDDARASDLFEEGVSAEGEPEDGGGQTPLVAVEVDQLLGRREVLVRSLGRHAKRWRGVAGAVDLRDGTVALLLDLPRLSER